MAVKVRVGVGCFVRHLSDHSLVLIGKRKGAHGIFQFFSLFFSFIF